MKKIYHNKWFPRIFYTKPDGGRDSGVTGYFLIEWKVLFSVGLLKFNKGSREAFHNHAFNAITWWLTGDVVEKHKTGESKRFRPSLKPKITKRDCYHKIVAEETSYALTLRGPWVDVWEEFKENKTTYLTHGRKLVREIVLKEEES